jgi:hypothetical protein
MICDSCRIAGYLNSTKLYARAARMHSECQHPETCPCQHETGDVPVNESRLPQ